MKAPRSQALVQVCSKNSLGLCCRPRSYFASIYKKSEAIQNVSRYEITGGPEKFHARAEESISDLFFLSIFSLLLSSPLKYVGSMQTQSLTKGGTQRLQAPPPSFCCDTVLPVKLVHTFLCSFNSPLILCLCRMCEIQWCLMVRKQHC